jgi:hypothetical protein
MCLRDTRNFVSVETIKTFIVPESAVTRDRQTQRHALGSPPVIVKANWCNHWAVAVSLALRIIHPEEIMPLAA